MVYFLPYSYSSVQITFENYSQKDDYWLVETNTLVIIDNF